ncbi:hypothetical protein [Nitrincola alkalilacustris]|uniref:hypothetical protein n=1 Tax=Nitrincola alkalilacustris TaxID=1571224 RepID=UPI00124C196E|nr:hypothetical protein [Nitrincola alkalilacustris]
MTRIKKQRRAANLIVLDKTPKKKERLADPDSYESRKLKALVKRKKHKSVFQKAQEQKTREERDAEAGRRGGRALGPLADKIRKMNAKKKKQEAAEAKKAASAEADSTEAMSTEAEPTEAVEAQVEDDTTEQQ